MALAMAAAAPVMPISPMPRAPSGLNLVSGMLRHGDVDGADVGVDGDVVLGEVFVDGAAVDGVDVGLFVEGEGRRPRRCRP